MTDLWGLVQDVEAYCAELLDSAATGAFETVWSDDAIVARQALATASIAMIATAREFRRAVDAEDSASYVDAHAEHRLSMQQLGVTPGRTA